MPSEHRLRTFVHLGQHKTGTTSIQMFLKEQAEPLRARGLYVPLPGQIHALLNVYSLARDRMSSVKEDLRQRKHALFFWSLGWRLRRQIARHYHRARAQGCRDVLWSNEGLYLLNSAAEYQRLVQVFAAHSDETVAVCCFRDRDEYRASYMSQLEKDQRPFSADRDSYRYVDRDSWLFDFDRKRTLLEQTFDRTLTFDYDSEDNVRRFFQVLGYPVQDTDGYRHNVTT
ncbi:MAG: hypothetical protein AAGF97_19160 [Planctomycetota bacterium]